MAYHSDYYDADNYDPDQSAEPCEKCGGNFDGAECDTLCEGCDGCPVSSGPCHGCTCAQDYDQYEDEPRCYVCGGYERQCAANPTQCKPFDKL